MQNKSAEYWREAIECAKLLASETDDPEQKRMLKLAQWWFEYSLKNRRVYPTLRF